MAELFINVSSQVCTLKQAGILQRLGLLQKSLLYHHKSSALSGDGWAIGTESDITTLFSTDVLSAFNTAELGAMLLKETRYCYYHPGTGMWSHEHALEKEKLFSTQAQAYAARLIWRMRIEPLKYTAEFVNQRLINFYKGTTAGITPEIENIKTQYEKGY